MSMRLRVANLRGSHISDSLNVCSDDDRIPVWASMFQERALNYGRWWGTTTLMRLCLTTSGCIILPREVAVIEAANLNGVPMRMGNMWYQFVKPHTSCTSSPSSSGAPCSPANFACSCCDCKNLVLEDRGTVASFSTTVSGQKIRVYPGNAEDVGKEIIIQGYDSNGVWVRSGPTSARIDGEKVTLAMPFVDTTTVWGVGAPTAVIKDPTEYRVLLYALDTTTGDEFALAQYQPSETEPMYRMVSIPGYNDTNCGCTQSSTKTLLAVVSLQHIPLEADEDWLLLTNLAAYKQGMLAEKAYEDGNMELGDRLFFGGVMPPRNGRGILRSTRTMGCIPMLEAELRKMTGDQSVVNIQYSTLNLSGFR